MPPKKKKKGGQAGKKKKDTVADQNKAICNRFLKAYIKHCNEQSVLSCSPILQECRRCVEEDQLMSKFIVEGSYKFSGVDETARVEPVPPADDIDPGVSLKPVLKALEEVQYPGLVQLHVWHFPLKENIDASAGSLALYLESRLGINVKVLELVDNGISQWAMDRIARTLSVTALCVLMLDHNWLTDPILTSLCHGLSGNRVLQCLSLNYCQIVESGGQILGTAIVSTLIKDVSLNGNALGCEGTVHLMSPLLHLCEAAEPIPPLAKIFLQDNSIDSKGRGGTFAPVICMRTFRRLITSDPHIEEIDFEHNYIGDAAGREILHAMQQRRDVGYPSIRMTVTHRMNPDTFAAILDLSTSYGGKKAKKKKKKGKK